MSASGLYSFESQELLNNWKGFGRKQSYPNRFIVLVFAYTKENHEHYQSKYPMSLPGFEPASPDLKPTSLPLLDNKFSKNLIYHTSVMQIQTSYA
jgi:hypothetical protein